MTQKVIVAVVLLLTAVLAVRWLVRTLRGRGQCGCAGCDRCPMSGRRDCHCHDTDRHLPDVKV